MCKDNEFTNIMAAFLQPRPHHYSHCHHALLLILCYTVISSVDLCCCPNDHTVDTAHVQQFIKNKVAPEDVLQPFLDRIFLKQLT